MAIKFALTLKTRLANRTFVRFFFGVLNFQMVGDVGQQHKFLVAKFTFVSLALGVYR